jgi:hypothetical protein
MEADLNQIERVFSGGKGKDPPVGFFYMVFGEGGRGDTSSVIGPMLCTGQKARSSCGFTHATL